MLTTHYLEEADAIADRVVVIDHGAGHRRRHRGRAQVRRSATWSRLGFGAERGRGDRPPSGAAWLAGGARRRARRARRSRSGSPRGARPGRRPGHRPRRQPARPSSRIEVVGPTLDDVFLDLTGRSLRESNEHRPTSTDDERRSSSMTHVRRQPDRPHAPRAADAELTAPGVVADTWNVMVRELQAGVPRAGLRAVRDGPAAGLPRPVRAAAARRSRTARRCSGSCPASSR